MSLPAWDEIVERRIRQAQERGEFEHLAGKGHPLDLTDDPFVEHEWRLAHRMLKDAGFTPDWLALGKEIRRELAACREELARSGARHEDEMAGCGCSTDDRAHVERQWERAQVRFAERVDKLNRKIDLFNLKVPIVRLQRCRVSVEGEMRKLKGMV